MATNFAIGMPELLPGAMQWQLEHVRKIAQEPGETTGSSEPQEPYSDMRIAWRMGMQWHRGGLN